MVSLYAMHFVDTWEDNYLFSQIGFTLEFFPIFIVLGTIVSIYFIGLVV